MSVGTNRMVSMDISARHIAQLPRRFGLLPQVRGIGHVPRKTDWVRNTFQSFNYSFIVTGGGAYTKGSRTWDVVAPCVITQWPGEYLEYGPMEPWGSWEEIYFIYDSDTLHLFSVKGMADPERPVWPVHDYTRLAGTLRRLEETIQSRYESGWADRVDHICAAAVMESYLGRHLPPVDHNEKIIRDIRDLIRRHYKEDVDLESIAQERGMSRTSFRRHWNRHVDVPPAKYVARQRVREARRLLVETAKPVGEIAREIGFTDPLYFSRKFRAETGMAATEYRRVHRMGPTEQ
jgi:AraC-like DNA-binding protein